MKCCKKFFYKDVMNNPKYKQSQPPLKIIKEFEKVWGDTVQSGGFTQTPNDLIRGINKLGLNTYDFSVLQYIISVGSGFASAKSIAAAQGISIGTVRKSFRKLQKLDYVYFIREQGEANRFNIKGLVLAVHKISSNRQRDIRKKNMGIVVAETYPIREMDNNKDFRNTNKYYKEKDGIDKCRKTVQKITAKVEAKSKPP